MTTVTSQKIVAQIGGLRGASAYDLWLAEGNTGTLEEYLAEQAALTFTRGLFPGPRDALFPEEAAGFARVKAIRLYGADPAKVPILRFLFWKDIGTRFRMEIMLADNPSGTNAATVCESFQGSGTDVWTGQREITLAEVSGSGVAGTAIVDFTDPNPIEINMSPDSAAAFQRRQIGAQAMVSSAARVADIADAAAEGIPVRRFPATFSSFLIGGNAGVTGDGNTGVGYGAAAAMTSGAFNTAIGIDTLNSLTVGSFNTAVGGRALRGIVSGSGNVALGWSAGLAITSGGNNVLLGQFAGVALTTGSSNVAIGLDALRTQIVGVNATAVGSNALYNLTVGGSTGVGSSAGFNLTIGNNLTAIGRQAGFNLTTGNDCTFVGHQAGYGFDGVMTGSGNSGFGAFSLGHTTTGSFNTGCGRASGWYGTTGSNNAWLGYRAGYGNSIGNGNSGVGFYAGHNNQTGNFNTYLGATADVFFPDVGAMAAVPSAGAGLEVGAYAYRVTFVIDGQETAPSEPVNVTTTAGNQQVNLSAIPVYVGPRTCTARNIYRTPVGGENLYFLVTTIADNVSTATVDSTADADLGGQPSAIGATLAVGYGARAMRPRQAVFGSTSARFNEVFFGGGVDDTAPEALTLSSSNASGTNLAGADLRLRGGAGTGTGNGGRVILAAAKPGSSGTAGNVTADILVVDGRGFLNMTETTAADVPTPAPGSVNIFLEGGDLKFRRPDGTVRTISTV